MSKRPADFDDTGSDETSPNIPIKRFVSNFEQAKFDNIRSIDELNTKTLQIQNKKLTECLQDHKHELYSLKERIEQLEDRQAKDDEMMCLVNKYWNILDEDCQVLLCRFEAENEFKVSEAAEYFLKQLAVWDKEQLETKLKERVHFSKRIISRLVEAFERINNRFENIRNKILSNLSVKSEKESNDNMKMEEVDTQESPVKLSAISKDYINNMDEIIKNELHELHQENIRIQKLCSEIQTTHHKLKSENLEMKDKAENYTLKLEEWKSKYDEMEYNLAETNRDYNRMNRWLMETNEKNKALKEEIQLMKGGGSSDDDPDGPSAMARSKVKELVTELEDTKELAAKRLTELEKLEKKYQQNLEEITRLRLQEIPESVILDSVQYKSLNAQFNILYKEAVNMQSQLEEARNIIQTNRQHHLKQIEEMEINESLIQNQMRSEMIVLRQEYSKLRTEHETLDLELKQTICHNQHSAPIASEMRSLIDTLREHANQAKNEAQRSRKKYKEIQASYDKLKLDNTNLEKEYMETKQKMKRNIMLGITDYSLAEPLTEDEELLKNTQQELKQSQEKTKEQAGLLAAYDCFNREQREKALLMASESGLQAEIASLREEQSRLKQNLEKRLHEPDPDQLRRVRKMEETLRDYQQKLALAKQQEDAMINDSTVTIQAYEDVLEQNSRLLQTLKEKDENNLKLMTDRMKANQTAKLLKEDQQLLEDQIRMYKTQIEALNRSVLKHEEKERLFLTNLNTLEKESTARQQALELHKRKAMEYQQTAEDLRMNLQKYLSQLKESQTSLQDKAAAQAREAFKQRRIKDDMMLLRRKYERIKKLEHSNNADEVLLTEIQTYKDILTCPTCKSNKKDAILTKCFHVFCLSCLKTRYEMRNRKCPKCNATFGANDYHHIYLT